ncbi:hypothetical protein LUZ63_007165 [Rhynchospora breviuscula]|uniref:SAC domain-containing protein n=1 Tax=Rhynchospora breviuscula TaxID=2022672 RepID=A0A9Q0HUT9_9POAL|nr:hypothetical protein LUZ63_007165 [Rhynchospora breviuscula]
MAAQEAVSASGMALIDANSFRSFELYENRVSFFMIGTNNDKSLYKILTIDRLKPSELDISEDPNTYNETEYNELIEKIKEDSIPNGGFNFVTRCYGIIGFIKFLGPYYMLLITEREKIGDIFGHAVYKPAKSRRILVPCIPFNFDDIKYENRYKNLCSMIDVTKDFYYSHTYNVMRSLQKNLLGTLSDENVYDSMFVWNEYLTRHLRSSAKSDIWTVPLVYGFFKQEKYSVSENNFIFTLIGRRSRYFAGTRYLRRGVNTMGRVANDVETEQIVVEDVPNPIRISSILQHRGSIPLFWSQETNLFNPKPDIILGKNMGYEATLLHFKHLEKRYGTPIIILNLIKQKKERRPRESLLRREFVKAIENINNQLPPKNQLQYLHWDVHMKPRGRPAVEVLVRLAKIAENSLKKTGYFYSRVPPPDGPDPLACWSAYLKKHISDENNSSDNTNGDNTDDTETLGEGSQCTSSSSDTSAVGTTEDIEILNPESPMFQKGILRTNCIDCLDRTNVAQYAFGLVALWHQLHALGLVDDRYIDLDYPLARNLMRLYEIMGDTLARQYGGSDAHNKIFSERRGHTKFLIRTHEFFRTIQRHYSNALMDANKQAAINLFLGNFEPEPDKPAIWEIGFSKPVPEGDQVLDRTSSLMRRALSDGSILDRNHLGSCPIGKGGASSSSTCSCVCTPSEAQKHFVSDNELATDNEEYEESNFFDTSVLYGELPPMSSPIIFSPTTNTPTRSTGDVNDVPSGEDASTSESRENEEEIFQGRQLIKAPGFSDKFRYWVEHEELMGFY